MSAPSYPQPPWQTYGRAFFATFLVPARALRLPAGLEPELRFGYATGMLGYVQYVAPSPLTYEELFWAPCLVRARSGGVASRGMYIDQMVVDSEASVAGGRELWALPKTLAQFSREGSRITVDTEAGARFVLDTAARGPRVSAPTRAATLQVRGAQLVRFASRGTGKLSSGRLSIAQMSGADAWSGLAEAKRVPGMGAAVARFETTMLPARVSPLDSAR